LIDKPKGYVQVAEMELKKIYNMTTGRVKYVHIENHGYELARNYFYDTDGRIQK
jgi:hypothetical protein